MLLVYGCRYFVFATSTSCSAFVFKTKYYRTPLYKKNRERVSI